jgi:hypothetical protein
VWVVCGKFSRKFRQIVDVCTNDDHPIGMPMIDRAMTANKVLSSNNFREIIRPADFSVGFPGVKIRSERQISAFPTQNGAPNFSGPAPFSGGILG